jgi:uridine kinase
LIAQAQNRLIAHNLPIEHIQSSEEAKFGFILEKLNAIFENYEKQETPVFLYIREGLIEKIAYFLAGFATRPISFGVAGESASGKSTIAYDMIECIELFQKKYDLKDIITRINTDDYYYDRSEEVKKAGGFDNFVKNYDLDSPDALELDLLCAHIQKLKKGHAVCLPKYDMSGTAKRYDNCVPAKPGKIIVSEGLFTLTDKVKDAFDFKVFVEVDEEIQKERWFHRAEQRGIKYSANEMYENIMAKSKRNVRPTREHADIIINGNISRTLYKMFVVDILDVVEDNVLNRV